MLEVYWKNARNNQNSSHGQSWDNLSDKTCIVVVLLKYKVSIDPGLPVDVVQSMNEWMRKQISCLQSLNNVCSHPSLSCKDEQHTVIYSTVWKWETKDELSSGESFYFCFVVVWNSFRVTESHPLHASSISYSTGCYVSMSLKWCGQGTQGE